jgi:diacylglycerol kinase family enzyme
VRKILFVYNPVAGKGLILNRIKEYKKVFEDRGDTCVFYETKGKAADEKALAGKYTKATIRTEDHRLTIIT